MDFWFSLNNPIKPCSVHDKISSYIATISKSQKSYLSLTVAVFYVTSVVNCLVSISIPLRAVVPPKGSWKLHDQPLAQGSKHHDPTLLPRPHYPFWPVPKGIRDIHGFWIPHSGFRIRRAWFWILFQWRLDSGFQSQAGFLEPYSGLQSPEFWIPRHKFPRFRITWAKIPGFWNLDSLTGGEVKPRFTDTSLLQIVRFVSGKRKPLRFLQTDTFCGLLSQY